MTESDEDNKVEAAPGGAEEQTTFTDELKGGLAVLLHVRVGVLESASIQLIDGAERKLVIKTDRDGWCSWCSCFNRRYEIVAGQLEPVSVRVHTSKLSRSVAQVNGGDPHLVGRVLERSLSLIRRYPSSDSIDITFATAETEERFRTWAHRTMTITPPKTTPSSRRVVRALQGMNSLADSDTETAVTEDHQTPKLPFAAVSGGGGGGGGGDGGGGGGSAAVHPAPRRDSLKPLKAQPAERSSGGVGRRGSASSSGWESQDGPGGLAISSASVESARSLESVESIASNESDDQAPLTWKEPPMVRTMPSSSSSGKGRRQSLSRAKGVSPASTKPLGPEPAAAAAAAPDSSKEAKEERPRLTPRDSFPGYPKISSKGGGSPPPGGPQAGGDDEGLAAAAPPAALRSPEGERAKKKGKKKKNKK